MNSRSWLNDPIPLTMDATSRLGLLAVARHIARLVLCFSRSAIEEDHRTADAAPTATSIDCSKLKEGRRSIVPASLEGFVAHGGLLLLPLIAASNTAYVLLSNFILFAQRSLRFSLRQSFSYLLNSSLRELHIWIDHTALMILPPSSLLATIYTIIRLRANEEMIWIEARGIVATMTYQFIAIEIKPKKQCRS